MFLADWQSFAVYRLSGPFLLLELQSVDVTAAPW